MITYKSKTPKIRLVKDKSEFYKVKIQSSKDAYDYIKSFYDSSINIYESFFLLMTNRANNTIGYVMLSQGGTIGTVVDVKIIAKYCVDSLCNGVTLAHNHLVVIINHLQVIYKLPIKLKKH